MALNQHNQNVSIDFRYIKDTGLQGGSGANNNRSNIMGTSGKLYSIFIDNTETNNGTGYLKLYDTAAAVTEGTTEPSFIFKVQAAMVGTWSFPEGLTFSAGMGYAISDSPGKNAGAALGAKVKNLIFTFK